MQEHKKSHETHELMKNRRHIFSMSAQSEVRFLMRSFVDGCYSYPCVSKAELWLDESKCSFYS